MLARYKIFRGPRPDHDPLPRGIRQDTRKHTRHVLAPTQALVTAYLRHPTDAAWAHLKRAYLALLSERFLHDRKRFDQLAELASDQDLYIGCSCPTQKNPDVNRCHTVLALDFMKQRYPGLSISRPSQRS